MHAADVAPLHFAMQLYLTIKYRFWICVLIGITAGAVDILPVEVFDRFKESVSDLKGQSKVKNSKKSVGHNCIVTMFV